MLTSLVIAGSWWFLRRIPRFALWEEQAFREGCELWSVRERVQSAWVFGVAHLLNLIYPIATVLALVGGGWLFMLCYLHEYPRARGRARATYRPRRYTACTTCWHSQRFRGRSWCSCGRTSEPWRALRCGELFQYTTLRTLSSWRKRTSSRAGSEMYSSTARLKAVAMTRGIESEASKRTSLVAARFLARRRDTGSG